MASKLKFICSVTQNKSALKQLPNSLAFSAILISIATKGKNKQNKNEKRQTIEIKETHLIENVNGIEAGKGTL